MPLSIIIFDTAIALATDSSQFEGNSSLDIGILSVSSLGIEGSTGFTLFLHDFVNQLHRELYGADFLSEIQKLELTELMAEIDFRLVEGGGEAIQLDALTARLSKLLG